MLVKRVAACAHLSSTVLRAIARYWSEIATFSYTPCILRIPGKCLVLGKLESWGYQAVKTV